MKIALLAKGETLFKYPGRQDHTEVWGLNQLAQSHDLDKCFIMDDLVLRFPHWVGPEFPEWLKTYPKPIITSRAYPEWPTSVNFPIREVSRHFKLPLGISYYSTVDYMLAYATYLQVDQIDLYGVDCAHPKREETARVSIGKWIGVVQGRGIKVTTQPGSFFHWFTVTGVNYEQALYGYAGPPRIEDLA